MTVARFARVSVVTGRRANAAVNLRGNGAAHRKVSAATLRKGIVDRVVIAAKVGKTGAASSAAGVAAQAKAGAANRGAA